MECIADEKEILFQKIEKPDNSLDGISDKNAPSDVYAPLETDPEPVCNLDDFPTSVPNKATTILTPPPNFKDVRDALPKNVQNQFSELLHGKIVGIWPIRSNYFIKNKHAND
ncbi:MAG: hypothetical protein LBJ78_03170 [Puniceicoccales bacterium]|jgi:hypothetical protein|nr:hypothetical protein [Puniceicoccales bacterium]